MGLPSLRTKLFQTYFRWSRALTLGAQGIVVRVNDNGGQEVLMVRHGYRSGWHFPGGGVEVRETVEEALRRELLEETGVIINGAPRLHGVFSNYKAFPGDHVSLYVIEDWTQPSEPKLGFEIRERGWFSIDALPEEATVGSRLRVQEVFHGAPVSPHWGDPE